MRVVVVYESMFGNTRLIADAIATGLQSAGDVSVVAVSDADNQLAESADVLVVGGPTHVHSMSRPSTRKSAADMASKPDSDLKMEQSALSEGVREWLDSIGPVRARVAAFDTRIEMPRWINGSAALKVARAVRRHGGHKIGNPMSFFVTKQNTLLPGELERAAEWGRELADRTLVGADR